MPAPKTPLYRRILEFRLFFAVNAIALALLALSFGREFVRNREIQHDIAVLQAQADALEAKGLEIAQLNTAFQTESYIEREARLKLGLKKPNEEVVVVQEDSNRVSSHASTTATEDVNREERVPASERLSESTRRIANPTKWWYYFFDRAQLETS